MAIACYYRSMIVVVVAAVVEIFFISILILSFSLKKNTLLYCVFHQLNDTGRQIQRPFQHIQFFLWDIVLKRIYIDGRFIHTIVQRRRNERKRGIKNDKYAVIEVTLISQWHLTNP